MALIAGGLTVLDAGQRGEVQDVDVARLALAGVGEGRAALLARAPRPAVHGDADYKHKEEQVSEGPQFS